MIELTPIKKWSIEYHETAGLFSKSSWDTCGSLCDGLHNAAAVEPML